MGAKILQMHCTQNNNRHTIQELHNFMHHVTHSTMSQTHHDSVQANLALFAKLADSYDLKPFLQTLIRQFAVSLLTFDVNAPRKSLAQSEAPLDDGETDRAFANLPPPGSLRSLVVSSKMNIIDFACGTGILVETLAPYISESNIVGIDINQPMLAKFDERLALLKQKYPKLEMRSVCGDVLSDDFDKTGLTDFADLLVCTIAFHHVAAYDKVAEVLKTFVKPGGWIFIYDFYNEDVEMFNNMTKEGERELAVSHHGIRASEMDACFQQGCVNVSSVREFRMKLWHEEAFIRGHCKQLIIDQLSTTPKKGDLYLVDCSVILGIAQRR